MAPRTPLNTEACPSPPPNSVEHSRIVSADPQAEEFYYLPQRVTTSSSRLLTDKSGRYPKLRNTDSRRAISEPTNTSSGGVNDLGGPLPIKVRLLLDTPVANTVFPVRDHQRQLILPSYLTRSRRGGRFRKKGLYRSIAAISE